MQHADLAYINEHLDKARHHISLCGDTLTGRDTYPLVADKIVEPFAFYLAIEIERMMGAITQMDNNVKQEAEDAKQLEAWEAEQVPPEPWPYRISCAKCDQIIQAPSREKMPHSICPHCGKDYHYYEADLAPNGKPWGDVAWDDPNQEDTHDRTDAQT